VDPLEAAARRMLEVAYCPYSSFRVGAALETSEGEVFSGCNVENASYSLTQCAERSAVTAMVSAGRRRVRRIVIVGGTGTPAAPCGACRQVLHEFGGAEIEVTVCSLPEAGERRTWTLGELLPAAFGPGDLGVVEGT